jgi:tetratricopeptide (TPR) repeat protein
MVELAIDLRCDLRNALARLGEHERTLDYLHEAEPLAQALEDQRRLGEVAAFLTFQYIVMGDYHQAVVAAQRTLASAEALGDFPLQVQGNFYLGQAYHGLGDYRQAIDLLRSNAAALEGERIHGSFGTAGLPSVTSRTVLALCLTELGVFGEALVLGEEAVRIAAAVNQPGMLVAACRGATGPYLRKGDFRKAIPLLERGVELCRAGLSPRLFADLTAALGTAYALDGHTDEALLLLEQAMVPSVLRQGFQSALPFLWVSEAYLWLGRVEDASHFAERALAHARVHHERGYQARALWLLGEVAAHRTPPQGEPAKVPYHQALTLADELGMRPLVAHCHAGLGTLYTRTGQREQARTELSAAIALYRAMDMTFWLPQAETGLAQVV